jgi:hypothetical protein
MMLRGWALAEQGREREGLAQIQQGLALWQANGQELGKPFWLALLGERYAKMGQIKEGFADGCRGVSDGPDAAAARLGS